MKKISILIADHHRLVREAWTVFLQHDPRFLVLTHTGHGAEAIEQVRQLRPDLVILGLGLPVSNSLDTTAAIRRYSPATKILVVSASSQYRQVKGLLQKGARGFLTKTSPLAELALALAELARGNKYLCTEIKSLLATHQDLADGTHTMKQLLTDRELQIVALIREGHSSKEIAGRLHVTIKTVQVHRHNMLKKLNMKNTPEMISFLIRKSLC